MSSASTWPRPPIARSSWRGVVTTARHGTCEERRIDGVHGADYRLGIAHSNPNRQLPVFDQARVNQMWERNRQEPDAFDSQGGSPKTGHN